MPHDISRRAFLKGSLGAACSAAAAVTRPENAEAKVQQEPLATLLDISRCIGCEECVYACREANAPKFPNPQKPFPRMYPDRVPVVDWSDRQDVTDRLTPYNWLTIQRARVTLAGEEMEINIPRRCMHCANPPCVKLCPWGAAGQLDNGISRIDPDLCLGGSKCNKVCPWDVPQRQTGVGLYLDILPAFAGNGVMYKCDRCHDRIAEGGTPACIEACPEGVQTIGPRSDIVRKAHELAREMDGYIYGETENGGTYTLYVSPVPFDTLARSIENRPGVPHLNPVEDQMALGTNMAAAMLLAPVAGVAAAAGRLYLHSRGDEK